LKYFVAQAITFGIHQCRSADIIYPFYSRAHCHALDGHAQTLFKEQQLYQGTSEKCLRGRQRSATAPALPYYMTSMSLKAKTGDLKSGEAQNGGTDPRVYKQ
jgi:hypothetical protein